MGFWSKIGKFLSDMTLSLEDKVNELSSAVVAALKRDVSEEQALDMLKAIGANYVTPQGLAQVLIYRLRDASPGLESNIWIRSIYIVAICDTILSLLGEDTMSFTSRSLLSPEMNEGALQSRELQRASVDWAKIDQESLRDALWQSFGIKAAWKVSNHPCWELCRITDLEVWANDEWNRTHPRPKSQ